MAILFDPSKDRANVAKHGISLARVVDMEILAVVEDDRFDYGETRYRAFGIIDAAAYCFAFTIRYRTVRVISLRRAHSKEMRRYGL
jgi:uncharacterized protein